MLVGKPRATPQSSPVVAMTMRAVVLSDYAGAKEGFDKTKFEVQQVDEPEPEDGQAVVKVMASSVNPVDWKLTSGSMRMYMPLTFPATIGYDCSGVVTKVGPGVENVKVGDEVWGDVMLQRRSVVTGGAYGEMVVAKASQFALKPKNLSFEQAGVFPLVGLTSVQALKRLEVKEGSKVLILGASGGTGMVGVQIAKAWGATVYTTCSTRNLEFVKTLNADEVIDYTKQNWGEVLKGKDLDAVYDCTGEPEAFEKAIEVLKEGGNFVSLHWTASEDKWRKGIKPARFSKDSDSPADLDVLKGLCEEGKLTLPIEVSFPLEQVADAFELSMKGKAVGKIGIKVAEKP